MANPFKKIADASKDTAKKWDSTRETPRLQTIVCPTCGAPRPVNTNLGVCAYCRTQLMGVEVLIKPMPE